MPLKERLVDRHILERCAVLPRNAFQDPIDQQEGIPMRQLPHDRFDIQPIGLRHYLSYPSNRRKCATIRRHSLVSTVGMPLE
jgi:hypothetical protein